ncbi:sensor histidine kinase [Roseivirga sp.]|uniref:sensor histidine kinase n=1 Tax=Roseivirga sp. TaxID=1964215 RepID=UPI003B521F97
MIFRGFKFQVIIRLMLVTAMLYGLLYYAFFEVNYIRVFFLGLFALLTLISLFYFITKTQKLTSGFLNAILNNDFTIKYPSESKNKPLAELYDKFNEVNDKFSQNVQHEANQYQYLMALINQLKIAVVAFDDRGRVHVSNQSFKELVREKEVIKMSVLQKTSPELYEEIIALQPNEQKVVKTLIDNAVHRFSVAASVFKLRQNQYTLVSLQDIHAELDQNEMQAWQRLIRVLTHEIMNSISPVVSLSGSLEHVINQLDESTVASSKQTLNEGIDAIKVRGQGLMNFTQAYRKLTRIPNPVLQPVEAKDFLQHTATLFNPTLADTRVSFKINQVENGQLLIDRDLMQQVIINLLKNALEAVDLQTGQIELTYSKEDSGRTILEIQDNGKGIPEEIAEQIFVPFYTTKQEGSGIGLSLARQIVQLHGGTLNFKTGSEGTTFFIKL